MSVPALRFKEFNSSWEVSKLGDLLGEKLSNGEMIGKSDFVQDSGNFYLIQLNDLYESNIQLLVNKLQMVKFNEKAKFVEVGDTLINRVSIKPEGVGKVTVITGLPSNLRTTFESNMFRVRFASEKVYQLFFAYFSLTKSYEKQKLALSKTTNQSSLSQSDISFIEISYPKIPEQTKIANFLTAVDERISQLTQKFDLLTQYKKGVMQQIFSQELRFKDDDGEDFPEWEDEALENLLDYEQPTKYLVSSTEYSDDYNTPVLTAGKTFILGYTNETNGICEQDLPVIIFDDFTTAFKFVPFAFKAKSSAMKILRKKAGVNISYIYSAMQLIDFPSGDEHKRYWISEYSKVTIPLPCQKEQTKIANFITAIDDKIAATQAQLDAVKQYKQGLLQQMFV